MPRRCVPAALLPAAAALALLAALPGPALGEVHTLTLFQKSGRAPIVVLAQVTDGENRLAELRTREVVRCADSVCPGESFRVAFRLESFLRKPWEEKITFTTGDEVVLFLRKFTKEDGERPDNDLYTLMWGAQGIVILPPEGAAAYLDAVRRFSRIGAVQDIDAQERMILEGLDSDNPFIIEAAFDEAIRQHFGGIDLVQDLTRWFDHPRDGFRVRAARLLGRILEDARVAGREIPRQAELADRVRGIASLDPSVEFRVAAVSLLGALGGEESRALIERLSREDPAQDVRYEASRILIGWKAGS